MSGSGKGWFDPYGDDANWIDSIPSPAPATGAGVAPSSKVGLFGGQYATMMENVARSRLAEKLFGPPADLSGDGTGLPPSVTIAPYLPQLPDPDVSRAQDTGSSGNGFSFPPRAGAQPLANATPQDNAAKPASFNLYDLLHRGLNTQFGSEALQVAHGLSQGMEKYGPYAAQLGTAGAVGGAVTDNLPLAAGSAALAILGASMDGLGHGLDAGSSFLKSIQQDDSGALEDFKRRMETPGFYDLEFPESK